MATENDYCGFPMSPEESVMTSNFVTLRPATILLADGSVSLPNKLYSLLRSHGHGVTHVANADWLFRRFPETTYDLVIADDSLPGDPLVEPLAFCQFLGPAQQKRPLVVICNDPRTSSDLTYDKVGVDLVITKPYRPIDLLAAVNMFVASIDALKEQDTLYEQPFLAGNGPSHSTVVNWRVIEGLMTLGGQNTGQQTLDQILRDFVTESSALLAQIERASERNDIAAMMDHCHALGSVSSFVGALSVHWLCRLRGDSRWVREIGRARYVKHLHSALRVYQQHILKFLSARKANLQSV